MIGWNCLWVKPIFKQKWAIFVNENNQLRKTIKKNNQDIYCHLIQTDSYGGHE